MQSEIQSDCPDEDDIVRFLDGQLSDSESVYFEEHLSECSLCRTLMSELGRGLGDAETSWQVKSGGDVVETGAIVDRYEIVEKIGSGAMGVVFRARDLELGREIALKLIRVIGLAPEQADRARSRLFREAMAMARLAHPNVVAVHDASVIGDSVFVAMELVDGMDVASWHKRTSRSWREIVDVFIEAGRGLIAAHAAGVIHRDFKPQNLLIGPGKRVRITDFGLAALSGECEISVSDSTFPITDLSITRTGTLMGTPAYMSPEVRDGQPATEYSDQYSFALSLKESLARNSIDAVDQLIAKAMSEEPNDRFLSMDALVESLERIRHSRIKRVWMGAVVGCVLLALGVYLGTLQREQAISCDAGITRVSSLWNPRVRATLEQSFLDSKISYAPAVFATATRSLDQFADAWQKSHRDSCEATHIRGEQSQEILDTRMHCLNYELLRFSNAVQLLSRTSARVIGNAIAISELDSGRGIARCADIETLRREGSRPIDKQGVDRIQAKYLAMRALVLEGKTATLLDEMQTLLQEARKIDYPRMEAALLGFLGERQWRSGDIKLAKETLYQALAAAERAHADDIRGGLMSVLVAIGYEQATYPEALAIAHLAELVLTAIDDKGRIANLIANRGGIHFAKGDFPKAESDYLLANAMMLQEYGENDHRTGRSYNNLALIAENQGRYQDAIDDYNKALHIYERVLGETHPEVALALANRATSIANLGNHQQALVDLEKVLKMRVEVLGPNHHEVGSTHRIIAQIANHAGNPSKALEHLLLAQELLMKSVPAGHPEMASAHAALGETFMRLDRFPEGGEELQKAVDIWRELQIENSHTLVTQYYLAQAIWERGEHKKAVQLAQQARTKLVDDPSITATIDSWLSERTKQ